VRSPQKYRETQYGLLGFAQPEQCGEQIQVAHQRDMVTSSMIGLLASTQLMAMDKTINPLARC